MPSVNDYADHIVSEFMKDITDHVFLNIQNNEELMREYQSQVHQHSLQTVNTAIGKSVRKLFDLENLAESDSPKSWLIESYMQHAKRQ